MQMRGTKIERLYIMLDEKNIFNKTGKRHIIGKR
jgi:hypothetical protein